MSLTVFFRDDDVVSVNPSIVRLIELYQRLEVPLSLEVIPKDLDDRFVAYFHSLKSKDLFDVGQHGYAHISYLNNGINIGEFSPREFGPNRSIKECKSDVEKGWNIIKQKFGIYSIKVFTPPWGLMNQDMYAVLKELGYEGFSLTRGRRLAMLCKKIAGFFYEPGIMRKQGMIDLSISMDNMKDFKKRIPKTTTQMINTFKRVSNERKYIGIMLHDSIMNDKSFEALEKFIIYLKDKKIPIKNMRQIIEMTKS